VDLTVVATPGYFGTMYAEHKALQRRAAERGPSAADYEPDDTKASLTMGVLSLAAPFVVPKLLAPIVPGKGKHATLLVAVALGAVAVTTVADAVIRREERDAIPVAQTFGDRDRPRLPNRASRRSRWARKVAQASGVASVLAGGVALTTAWQSRWSPQRMWSKRKGRDLGTGPLTVAAAILAWDFIYYWNHRFMHESRYMWAVHVVHHSSERYNLSTALRQPVADALGTFVPYTWLCPLGFRPSVIETARGINLLYQYWIHTDTIRSLGRLEAILNTPSHHRVHHGRNRQYIDRNHGSILIVWDRLFGTHEREDETVVYGLTKNVDSYNPGRIATHEHADILRDVAGSTSWRERLSYVLRGPGWAYARHAERAGGEAPPLTRVAG